MTRHVRRVITAAATAAAATVALAAAPGASHASAGGCVVTGKTFGELDYLLYESGDIIQTDAGDLVCNNGVWEGPNVDSPLPNSTGTTVA